MKKLAIILVLISATPAAAFDRWEGNRAWEQSLRQNERMMDQMREQRYETERQLDQMDRQSRNNPFFNQGY